MKRLTVMGLGLLVCCVGIQSQASIVYEGFDYASGSEISAVPGTGDGWSGNWSTSLGATGDGIHTVLAGNLMSGNAIQRSSRVGKSEMHRQIDADALTTGSTMYFSVLMNVGNNGAGGQVLNSYGSLVFGDTALTAGLDGKVPSMGGTGNAIGVGFVGASSWDNIQVQGINYVGGSAVQNISGRFTAGTDTVMIVGKVDWSTDGDDTVSLYNVTDTSAVLPTAFSTMTADLDQSTFDVVSIGGSQTAIFDEIRMDPTLAAVMIPEPATMGLVGAFGAGILFIRRRFNKKS